MALDSFTAILAHILERAIEDSTDATGDFYTLAQDAIIEVWRDHTTRIQTLELVKDPAGAFVTVAPITTLTLTIAAAGESVAGTLSATHASSLTGYKIKPTSKNWIVRITAHAAGAAAVTLDAVPEALAAGSAITIYKDEYDLASDLGVFVDGLWGQDGGFVSLVSEETLRRDWPDPPQSADTASGFCRLTRRKIRLSHYPASVRRYEYPYQYEPDDPAGATTLVIGAHMRPALAEGALAVLLDMKFDRRADRTKVRAEQLLAAVEIYERRRRMGFGTVGNQRYRGAYGV